jgi:hypothetical protein
MEKSRNKPLEFISAGDQLSLGVKVGLQVPDGSDLLLTPKAQVLLDACKNKKAGHWRLGYSSVV